MSQTIRKQSKCSLCGEIGHNKTSCTKLDEEYKDFNDPERQGNLDNELERVNREHALDSEIECLKKKIRLNSLRMDEDSLLFSEIGTMLKGMGIKTIDVSINLTNKHLFQGNDE